MHVRGPYRSAGQVRQCRSARATKWPGRFRFATIAEMSDQLDNRAPGGNALHQTGDHALLRCLSLDLEVGRNDGRVHALVGVRPDTGAFFTFNRRRGLPLALVRLDELGPGRRLPARHNLIDFDLPHLSATNPNLRLLQLPAVDRHAAPQPPGLSPQSVPLPGEALPGRVAQAGPAQRSPNWAPAWRWRFSQTSRRHSESRTATWPT